MTVRILTVAISNEQDVVGARQRARAVAQHLGFDAQDQTRIATAVSEVARNAHNYAGGGLVQFELEGTTAPQLLVVRISDKGPGIKNLDEILEGRYQSQTGMGLGLVGVHRLMDQCEITTRVGYGTVVGLKKILPDLQPAHSALYLSKLGTELTRQLPQSALEEVRQQNQELVRTLAELRERQDELMRLNRELEDTNRGVIALYAELDEKADHLRRADEMKTRFLHQMSHEFRTPLNSMLALSRLLLDRVDGELTAEQETQVQFIRKSAETLTELVNDLLDLAKIEAGKIEVHADEFSVSALFSALRGMLRPLLLGESTNLVFEEPQDLPLVYSDEGKVSQILRNFISNALKFTERGEVRVSAQVDSELNVVFSVADTGIGIARQDQQLIFEEFTQVHHPIQQRVKGTGLGLPLCRKLAVLLGGRVEVSSELGVGSVFSAIIPLRMPQKATFEAFAPEVDGHDPRRTPVLVVEDDEAMRLLYTRYLQGSDFEPLFADSLHDARRALVRVRPGIIILDVVLHGEQVWRWLAELKGAETTRAIPVLIVSTISDERKGLALGADEYCVKPIERGPLLAQLIRLRDGRPKQLDVLVIEDDESARYLLKKYLSGGCCDVREAITLAEGTEQIHARHPDVIFLDLNLPDGNGADLLAKLRGNAATRDIPVVIFTSQTLSDSARDELELLSNAILYKDGMSRDSVLHVLPAPG